MHRYTAIAPAVAVHIPWDKVDDYSELAAYARDRGVCIGTVNANVFQDDDYRLGSVCNPDPRIRRKALDHLLECVDIMDATGSRDLKLWFADGTNYPGQDDIRARQDRLSEALAEVYAAARRPAADAAGVQAVRAVLLHHRRARLGHLAAALLTLGEQAAVVVDTGHHAPGTNIEFIVALLLRAGRLGGFDFNSRFYADDDLMVGAADPFQLFRILHEVIAADALRPEAGIAFMLDQCHNIEPKIPAQIRSVLNVQEATAKALLVDARRAGGRAAGGGRARRQRRADGRLQHRRPAACSPTCARTWAWTATRSPPTVGPATASASWRTGSAAPRQAGAAESQSAALLTLSVITATGRVEGRLADNSNRRNYMAGPLMSLEQHQRRNHVVKPGRSADNSNRPSGWDQRP